ncbi:peroxiredoxin [PVC group bacterium (ex Bugula neritina AB1)]|nr:peroxiredoxin [PVC group bacterium (ex Bugula neritina AB1)]
MALVESVEIPLGMKMPSFSLRDSNDKLYESEDFYDKKGLCVVFTCNHCPYAIAVWPRLIALSSWALSKGVNFVAINPNIHPDYPEDSVEAMKNKVLKEKIPFPYLVDDTQKIASAFKAQCTPDFYLYDNNQDLFYHGRMDDNWKEADKVKDKTLENAIEDMVEGKTWNGDFSASMGCSIKWKN